MGIILDKGLESKKVEIQYDLNQEAQVDKDRLQIFDMDFQLIKRKFQVIGCSDKA